MFEKMPGDFNARDHQPVLFLWLAVNMSTVTVSCGLGPEDHFLTYRFVILFSTP